MTPLEYAWQLINEKEDMGNYSIETINPNVAYIVTEDDKPFVALDGQDLIFHRRRDAERFMREQMAEDGNGEGEDRAQETASQ